MTRPHLLRDGFASLGLPSSIKRHETMLGAWDWMGVHIGTRKSSALGIHRIHHSWTNPFVAFCRIVMHCDALCLLLFISFFTQKRDERYT